MSNKVCCEAARRIQREDTTLIGYDCPIHGLTSALNALPEILEMLRELEWADTGERGFSSSDLPNTRCPVCHGYGYRGHAPDCRLAALLREVM